jgi:hypothetical protein
LIVFGEGIIEKESKLNSREAIIYDELVRNKGTKGTASTTWFSSCIGTRRRDVNIIKRNKRSRDKGLV